MFNLHFKFRNMNPSDNIGLTDFLVLIYKFLKRHFVALIGFTLIGFSLGFIYTQTKPAYYYSELTGFSAIVEKSTILEIVSPLTLFAEEKNYTELGKALNITPEEAATIRTIEFTTSRHVKTTTNPDKNDELFGELIITQITVYSQELLPKIQTGIIHFLNTNTYLHATVQSTKQINKSVIEKAYRKFQLHDTLTINQNQQTEKIAINQISTFPFSYVEAMEYIEKLKEDNLSLQAFSVVNDFYLLKKPSNRNKLIITGLTVAFTLLGLIFVFIRELAALAKKD